MYWKAAHCEQVSVLVRSEIWVKNGKQFGWLIFIAALTVTGRIFQSLHKASSEQTETMDQSDEDWHLQWMKPVFYIVVQF